MDTSSPKLDIIADTLDMKPLEVLPPVTTTPTTDVENDYHFARCNITNIIQKGQEALDGILEVAERSQHPRGYEVAATLIKTLSDANKDLLELAKQKKNIEKEELPQNVTNNLFVGSTAELQKLIKKTNEQE